MTRKIAIITSSRADYGHSYYLINEVNQDKELELQLIVTGMHLSKKYGETVEIIRKDGFPITEEIPILKYTPDSIGTLKTIGVAVRKFGQCYERLKPDIIVLFGDRYETLAASIAAYTLGYIVAHVHGGETTQGVIDEGFRHSITKMSHIHFTATEDYRRRVIQLGEQPKFVFNYGAPGQDLLKRLKYLSKKELITDLDFNLNEPFLLVTYHPVTLHKASVNDQMDALLKAISASGINAIFTMANSDHGGQLINSMLEAFCEAKPEKYKLFANLGQTRYLSVMKFAVAVVGNSSSGLVEAPTLKVPTIDIGDRQKGRVKAGSVISSKIDSAAIKRALAKAMSKHFLNKVKTVRNPYCHRLDGKISARIKERLKKIELNNEMLMKQFYDCRINL